jgi:hypothetical protein
VTLCGTVTLNSAMVQSAEGNSAVWLFSVKGHKYLKIKKRVVKGKNSPYVLRAFWYVAPFNLLVPEFYI